MNQLQLNYKKMLVLLVTLSSVALLSVSAFHDIIDYWLRDQQQKVIAAEMYFTESVVLDIDDVSLKLLEPHVGNWPFSRDVYASVLDFLAQQGASNVVFDILFAESRQGDAQFHHSIIKHDIATLVAGTSNTVVPLSMQDRESLSKISWEVPSLVPLKRLQSIILPDSGIQGEDEAYGKVGVISASSDSDGVLRKISSLYLVGDSVLPALPVRLMTESLKPEISYESDRRLLSVGDVSWPIDIHGNIHLYFPKNANSILSIPFHEVAEVAMGLKQLEGNSDFFKNKTVFIGSTAYLSDRVNTPRGPMSGTYLLATAYETFKQNLVLKPDKQSYNLLLIFIALIPLFFLFFKNSYSLKFFWSVTLLLVVMLFIINFWLLKSFNQKTDLLLPLEILLFSMIALMGYYQVVVRRANLQLQQQRDLLFQVASTDTLTGLFNRRAFAESYNKEMERIKRHDGDLPAVAIMDLDHFKSVNDTYGHDIGDQVLKIFAEVMKQSVRKIDITARWGGEEFVVLLPATSVEDAAIVLDRVRREIYTREIGNPIDTLRVSVSIGVASVDSINQTLEDAIKDADTALYQAKENGRNQIAIFS